jgi:hypothetical protein
MAAQKKCEIAIDVEEHIKDLLECPVCIEPILSAPIHQCTNGHVVCNGCIAKLSNCPICRNDSTLVRNFMLEEIIEKLLVNKESSEKPETPRWGSGLDFVSFSNDRPIAELEVQINILQNQIRTILQNHQFRINNYQNSTAGNDGSSSDSDTDTEFRDIEFRSFTSSEIIPNHQNSTAVAGNDGSNSETIPKYLKNIFKYSWFFVLGALCLSCVIVVLQMIYKAAIGERI